ncbi:uncharacterized protein LOC129598650 [Paramacrobiotus metropolitanus]|uniref:uncharacterized protein LOC129598650 n=1 Tax=Paramacrobiotus metropolitanus TaxID=2943436 RepID=UPI0024463F75|nr:uncharacterized protein LOC129598650 [Paramacrobiotus metropolitanus]XP_055352625.1 uncharacterized protein LOC129598650 [Paramacrobiotus metropolitanus]
MTPPVVRNIADDDSINVTINGTKYKVPKTFSEVTLNDYLRCHLLLSGTKVCCREGGCGACVVNVAHPDPNAPTQMISRAINSCLCPVLSCDGWEVTTVEGIGDQKNPHPIQQRLTEHYGTQCGYCTPGMVMSMYSLLQSTPGNKPSKEEVETSIGGNICRCTGYRPIMDAFKTFAKDGLLDVEESNRTMCLVTGHTCSAGCHRNKKPSYVKPLPASVQDVAPTWHNPKSLDDLYQLLPQLANQNPYYLVGRTGIGVYNDAPYGVYVDLKGINDLYAITATKTTFSIGAAIVLTDVINLFEQQSRNDGFQHLKVLAGLIRRTAQPPVRNAGSWGGNLAMKHRHQDFPSETYLALTIANAMIVLGPDGKKLSVPEFLKENLDGKIILRAELPSFGKDYLFTAYKVMPRYQNAHALVNTGFRAKIDKGQAGQFTIAEKPILAFGNISPAFTRADKTESWLVGKNLGDAGILQQALTSLSQEIQPEDVPGESSPAFRRSLALSLFYKFALEATGNTAAERYRSAVGYLLRPVSRGLQTYPTKKENWPLTQPIPKIESLAQCTGEAKFISDIEQEGMLHAAFVLTEQANASIYRIDASDAMALPGVIRVLTAADITGKNDINPNNPLAMPEQLFADSQIAYAGQPVAVVVAETKILAESGAKLVKTEYSNVQPPLLTCQDAIQAKSFHDKPAVISVGDAETAVKNAPNKVSGDFEIGMQTHYHMETMTAVATATEDGINVEAGTQWLDYTQNGIAQILGINKSRINATVRRNGGGFGAKILRNLPFAAAASLATWILKRPVKMHVSLWDQSKFVGKRFPYYGKYTVGVDAQGKLLGVVCEVYCNCGSLALLVPTQVWREFGDNAYKSPTWKFTTYNCKTNLPPNTATRSPGSTEAIFFIEYMLEHVANVLKKPAIAIKQLNLYKDGDKTLAGDVLKYCLMASVTEQLLKSSEYQKRTNDIVQFNKSNRWRKRGLAMVPMRFPCSYMFGMFNVLVVIYHDDGSVAVTHGGIEIGQGINTKVAQVVAYELGIDLASVTIQPTATITNGNGGPTGGSTSSELCCLGAINCCTELKQRMQPVKDKLGPNASWKQIVEACWMSNIDMSARAWVAPSGFMPVPAVYHTYGAMSTEVEVDILTGEYQINRVDILYDCGESMSPFVDIGQVEGAAVQGFGYFTSEEVIFDKNTGMNLTPGTWKYKPPTNKDIPIDYRIEILQNAPNPSGILRGKIVGEPPLCMSCSVVFALRNAIASHLTDQGQPDQWFRIDTPMTVERVQQLGNISVEQLRYKD